MHVNEVGAMTGTLGANTMWDQMPFMAELKLVKKALMPTGIQHMELKVTIFSASKTILST
jgi:hypothetical protein